MSHPLLRPLEELIAAWRERSDDAEKDAKLDEEFEQGNSAKAYWIGKCVEDLERVLRESGLADLLEAGQAMREGRGIGMVEAHRNYDAALAKVKGKSA